MFTFLIEKINEISSLDVSKGLERSAYVASSKIWAFHVKEHSIPGKFLHYTLDTHNMSGHVFGVQQHNLFFFPTGSLT